MSDSEPDYSKIVLPHDLMWYEELGGQRTGWVCSVDGPGWWHVSELDLAGFEDQLIRAGEEFLSGMGEIIE